MAGVILSTQDIPYVEKSDMSGGPPMPTDCIRVLDGTSVFDYRDVSSMLRSIVPITSHAFLAADVGKPVQVNNSGVYSVWDEQGTFFPLAVLKRVIDANWIELALAGDTFVIAASLLPADIATQLTTGDRVLFWNHATTKYVYTSPAGATVNTDVIVVLQASGGDYLCLALLPRRPVGSASEIPSGGGSRKDGVHDLGTLSGAVTINFASGSYDNKSFTVGGNVTSWTFQNLVGEASLFITIDGTNRTVANMPAAADGGPGPIINQSANSKSIVKLTVNGSDIFYG